MSMPAITMLPCIPPLLALTDGAALKQSTPSNQMLCCITDLHHFLLSPESKLAGWQTIEHSYLFKAVRVLAQLNGNIA